jgi:hypothetical protein
VIVFILFQSLIFIKTAWRRGLEIGLDRGVMKKTMTNAAVFSVVPSLAIIIMLAVLTNNLGKYFPWLRLSVVGSAQYENMAADTVAKALGLPGISDPGFDLKAFTTAMWVMSVGIVWGIVFNIFFMKSLDKFSKKAKASNNQFIPIFTAALFIGMLSLMASPYLTNLENKASIVSFITSAITVLLCGYISKKSKIRGLDDFSLPIGLIVGMAAAVIYANIENIMKGVM